MHIGNPEASHCLSSHAYKNPAHKISLTPTVMRKSDVLLFRVAGSYRASQGVINGRVAERYYQIHWIYRDLQHCHDPPTDILEEVVPVTVSPLPPNHSQPLPHPLRLRPHRGRTYPLSWHVR
jgi:hypothetical protein